MCDRSQWCRRDARWRNVKKSPGVQLACAKGAYKGMPPSRRVIKNGMSACGEETTAKRCQSKTRWRCREQSSAMEAIRRGKRACPRRDYSRPERVTAREWQ
nr:hypothetical protein CFP56_03043 [Quercus suber]